MRVFTLVAWVGLDPDCLTVLIHYQLGIRTFKNLCGHRIAIKHSRFACVSSRRRSRSSPASAKTINY